jgi:hypothetical protein
MRKTAKTATAMKNSHLDMVRAPAAIFVNPKKPATTEIRKKMRAHFSIGALPTE